MRGDRKRVAGEEVIDGKQLQTQRGIAQRSLHGIDLFRRRIRKSEPPAVFFQLVEIDPAAPLAAHEFDRRPYLVMTTRSLRQAAVTSSERRALASRRAISMAKRSRSCGGGNMFRCTAKFKTMV